MAKTKAEESKRKVSNNSPKSGGNKKRKVKDEAVKTEEESTTTPSFAGEEVEEEELVPDQDTAVSVHAVVEKVTRNVAHREDLESKFVGDPVPLSDAKSRWPHRYPEKKQRGRNLKGSDDEDEIREARCHYLRAEIDGTIYELNDDAHVMSEEGKDPYICKIKEFFVDERDGSLWFRAQWYYRAKDTVIQDTFAMREPKRIFPSEVMDDNPLDCLLGRLKIVRVKPNLDVAAKLAAAPECDYYYDMHYKLSYNSFVLPPGEIVVAGADSESALSSDADDVKTESGVVNQVVEAHCSEMTLLDLYCGCGAMSTGLCLGANLCGINLVTKWAVDLNEYACESVKLNHPETQVRNETVENFLMLLKEWERLCATYKLIKSEDTHKVVDLMGMDDEEEEEDEDESGDQEEAMDSEVFEVEKMMEICYGDPNNDKKTGLYFKVRWKGYGASEDTWEPVDGLGNCRESIGVFVKEGFKNKVLPLPGDVDMVCGGPPCQGISGFNRFRNRENPLADEKNKQLLVFMNVVNYLKPKYVLMENVVDLVKFAKGFLGSYAVGSLVDMNYQARMGMMAAGAYGLPQFRMRVFVWGTQPTEKLVPYPLPTHDLVLRGVIPSEFETNVVAYNEGHNVNLQNKLFLGDAITDLPEVNNDEHRDVMPYDGPPQTEFQRFIRLTKDAMCGRGSELLTNLYDHRPLKLNNDDYQRVCRVPKRKGANFRDFPGVRVRHDNKVEWDPDVERVILPSGKPLVPEYAMTFVQGTSSKPFGRLWWDQTVPTVVTRAEPHNQTICHPLQDRVLTIRENARLQGFPDYYQLIGPIKQRYMQVGNAVAVPVARALGFGMAMANKGLVGDDPLFVLPEGFPAHPVPASPAPSIEVEDS